LAYESQAGDNFIDLKRPPKATGRLQGFTGSAGLERSAAWLPFRSTVLLFLSGAACLVCFVFAADAGRAFGSRQCRLIILFSTGGVGDETAGTIASAGCNAEGAGIS
jgi:hypothetical protein